MSADAPPDSQAAEHAVGTEPARRGPLRRLYDWVLVLSRRPTAERALGLLAFAESMFFPIPPDVMLIPMCVAQPRKALRFAGICSIASILGGIGGYALGTFFWQTLDSFFYDYVPGFTPERFGQVQALYQDWNFWVVFTAGFTPIPYKIITVTAGVFQIAFPVFVIASAISRSARFFLVAGLLKRWGSDAQDLIERHFNLLATAFVLLLLAGFWLVGKI